MLQIDNSFYRLRSCAAPVFSDFWLDRFFAFPGNFPPKDYDVSALQSIRWHMYVYVDIFCKYSGREILFVGEWETGRVEVDRPHLAYTQIWSPAFLSRFENCSRLAADFIYTNFSHGRGFNWFIFMRKFSAIVQFCVVAIFRKITIL